MSRTNHHGDKKKQRLFGDAWHWVWATPSSWVRMMMQKPQRRAASLWQREIEKTNPADLAETDNPPHGKKPHIYYW